MGTFWLTLGYHYPFCKDIWWFRNISHCVVKTSSRRRQRIESSQVGRVRHEDSQFCSISPPPITAVVTLTLRDVTCKVDVIMSVIVTLTALMFSVMFYEMTGGGRRCKKSRICYLSSSDWFS